MKTREALLKNFKLLFRSRETAFTIVFGPLLIILLVGFAFSGGDDLAISLGVYSPEYTPLADDVIQSLQKEYQVNILSSYDECIQNVKVGINQLCIVFPEDFVIREKHTNNVEFHVDPSRINLVYQVLEELGSNFDVQREQLSLGLTGTILNNLNATKHILHDQSDTVDSLIEHRLSAAESLRDTDGKLEAEEINFSTIDLRLVRGLSTSMQQDVQTIYDTGVERLKQDIVELNQLKGDCDDCTNATRDKIDEAISEINVVVDELNQVYSDSPPKLTEISRMIDTSSSRLESIKTEYSRVQEGSVAVKEKIVAAQESLLSMRDDLSQLKGNLDYAYDLLDGVAIADSETLVSPIRTSIEEVTTESNLAFTYPYVLMLVIMFMGLMLGSTLIVTDKNSRAAFRNFTTSTRDEFHIVMSFITTLLILLSQVLIILFFSYFLVSTPLLSNFWTTLLILLLSITLFSFLGMILGYLSHSQEAAMISSLTLGSIMLFISNLVIPTEAMKTIVRAVANLNPYVVLSEMLKKSMLFNVKIGEFGGQLALVFFLAIFLLVLIFGVQQYVRRRYFQKQATIDVKRKKVKPLELANKTIKDEFDLLTVLDLMTREEFSKIVTEKENPLRKWALVDLENKKLASVLNTTSKEKMIIRLDKYLKKQTKKLKSKH